VITCVYGQLKDQEHVFNADYVLLNATDKCYQKAQSCQSVQSVCRAYMAQTGMGPLISSDDPTVYADWFQIDRQAVGNEAMISSGIAHANDLKVGDIWEISLGGADYGFVIAQIKETACNYAVINAHDVGIPYNMLLVKGKDGVSKAELLGELSETTASELAPIIETGNLLERFVNAVHNYMNSAKILLFVFVIFSLIGVVDISYESLRARREEFELYRLAGMERRELRLMKSYEFIIGISFGIAVGLIAFAFSAFAVNQGMSAKAMEVFQSVSSLFR
jgi:ABC-type antimicrobial peptide transport system permease subunit